MWRDVVAISAGSHHSLGLRHDGTVVAAGADEDGQCEVESWREVVEIAAGSRHSLGLTRDGRVLATGADDDGQCRTGGWLAGTPARS